MNDRDAGRALRMEKDLLGEMSVPFEALYGIHTMRAMENFPLSKRTVYPALIHAYGLVKAACAQTNFNLGFLPEARSKAILQACAELAQGQLDAHIMVDALQGGAGTSTNMNVNEVICNRALQLLGRSPGDYEYLHPIDHINLHQSTNDTYPTALRVAAIGLLRNLEQALVGLTQAFQDKEKEFASIVKIGRTEMQDAVLTTMGRTMSAYAEAIARDRWRVYKCEERLRVVNLGGTAIGSGVGAPRRYIFEVVENLKKLTGYGLSRGDNLTEATQNADAFVEVSGILSACASNLFKIANDLRFMASGPSAGIGEISLPQRQVGSSLMPGKINPVIPEAVIQVSIAVQANHQKITQAASQGNLELNAFMPLIADALLENLTLLSNACDIFYRLCVQGATVNEAVCRSQVENSTAVLTALVGRLGYQIAQEVAQAAQTSSQSIRQIILGRGLMSSEEFNELISPEQVLRLGE